MTIADLGFFDLINRVAMKKGDSIFDSSPVMKKHFDKVGNVAGVQKWIEKRPKTDM